jgi:progranulin
VAATKRVEKSPQTLCPGSLVDCNEDTTCCQLPSGQFGCCLLSDAICCSDQRTFFLLFLVFIFLYLFILCLFFEVHCCPSGMKCNNEQGSCESLDNSTIIKANSIQVKPEAKLIDIKNNMEDKFDAVTSVVCPDGIFSIYFSK